ncbi:hypothetical protein BC940DRAFT_301156 [Gongronella butleri]|nr:hypothetical protein BC940DRAFT_301156 [Gongronella butleri]
MPQAIQPYPSMDTKAVENVEASPVIVPSMSPVAEFPLYYYYYLQAQAMPRPFPIHQTLENATISFDAFDYPIKWHKDLLVKDVFLSPPMVSSTATNAPAVLHVKKEVAPSDLILDETEVFGLSDASLLLEEEEQQDKKRTMDAYAHDLPTPPALDYGLGMKRRHSSICSSGSDSDDQSVQSENEKRPCLMHSPCSLPESPAPMPMFDFDDDEAHPLDQQATQATDFQPYPTMLESMTDDEDDDMTLHQADTLELIANQRRRHAHPTPSKQPKTAAASTMPSLTPTTAANGSTGANNANTVSNIAVSTPSTPPASPDAKPAAKKAKKTKKQAPKPSKKDEDDEAQLPVYVPHGAAEVSIRYSSQGLYKHLLKQRVDWCRYCGTTEGVNWRPGPWGKRTLCNKHGCDYKGYGFACKLPRLDLTAFVKEPMDQRIRPVLQLFCSVCHGSTSWDDNLLVQCDGCPMAYHQHCRRQQDLTDEFCASAEPFFCDHACKDNLKKKRVVVEFSRKRLPLMRTPKQQAAAAAAAAAATAANAPSTTSSRR